MGVALLFPRSQRRIKSGHLHGNLGDGQPHSRTLLWRVWLSRSLALWHCAPFRSATQGRTALPPLPKPGHQMMGVLQHGSSVMRPRHGQQWGAGLCNGELLIALPLLSTSVGRSEQRALSSDIQIAQTPRGQRLSSCTTPAFCQRSAFLCNTFSLPSPFSSHQKPSVCFSDHRVF